MAGQGRDNQAEATEARGAVSVSLNPPTVMCPTEHPAHPVPSPASIHLYGSICWGIEMADWLVLEEGWEC